MVKSKNMRGRNFQKKVTEIVRKELQEELEEKTAVIGATDVFVQTPAIPNGNVFGNRNFIQLFPSIPQGTGEYNERIGNEIRLKSIDIKMLLHYKSVGVTEPENSSIGMRVMILRQKDQGSVAGLLSNFQGNKLLENGSTVAGPAQFFGNTFNLLQKINREQFSVRYDKVHYLDNPAQVGTSTGGQFFMVGPPRPKVVSHKLTFGKQGLKLTYGDAASTDPTNFPYVMVIGYASTVSAFIPDNGLVAYSYSANAKYTDA